jgi:hypothetical protein
LPEKGHPPQVEDVAFLVSSNAPRLELAAFFLALGQQLLAFWLQDGASSEAPRLGLADAQQGLVQSGPHFLALALAVQAALQAALQDEAQAGVSSAALRLGFVAEPLLAQPAIARTRLIPRVLSMNFMGFLQRSLLMLTRKARPGKCC